jgi:hypothetical protein
VTKDKLYNKRTTSKPTLLADPFVFFIFPTAHFFKFNFSKPANGTLAFAPTAQANPSAKAKEPFFS